MENKHLSRHAENQDHILNHSTGNIQRGSVLAGRIHTGGKIGHWTLDKYLGRVLASVLRKCSSGCPPTSHIQTGVFLTKALKRKREEEFKKYTASRHEKPRKLPDRMRQATLPIKERFQVK